ncbi:MAG: YihY/virulence factor BrkB family protein, partial [Deltaproteobacteria bacterium]
MKNFLAISWEGAKVFLDNQCFTRAAAISFYAFFSLIPFMILITAAIGFVLGSHAGLLDKVINVVREALPYLSDRIVGDLRGLSGRWKSTGWLGLIFLLWSAEAVLAATSEALNAIFGTQERWGFVRQKIINLLVLCLATIAAFISIIITAASLVLRKVEIRMLGVDISYYLIESLTFKYMLPFFLVAGVTAVIYRISSGPSLNFRYAFYGSVLFTFLWEAAKHLFTWYISNFSSYSKFY